MTINTDFFYFEIYDHLKIKDEIEDNDYFKTSSIHTIAFFFRLPLFEQKERERKFLELELRIEIPHDLKKARVKPFSLDLNSINLPDSQGGSFYESKSHVIVNEKCHITQYNFYEFVNTMTTKHIDKYLMEIKYPSQEKKKIAKYFSEARFEAINSLIKLTAPDLKCDNNMDEIEDFSTLIEKLKTRKNFLNLENELKTKNKYAGTKKI